MRKNFFQKDSLLPLLKAVKSIKINKIFAVRRVKFFIIRISERKQRMNRSVLIPDLIGCFVLKMKSISPFVMQKREGRIILNILCFGAVFMLFSLEIKDISAQENGTVNTAVSPLKAETFSEEKTEVVSESAVPEEFEGRDVLFLEIIWLRKSLPREALLAVSENKAPILLTRILDTKDRLTRLWAARVALSFGEDDSPGIQAECFEPKILWGENEGEPKEIPDLIVIQGTRGAIDLGGDLAPCLVLPVTKANEAIVLEKYLGCLKDEGRETK